MVTETTFLMRSGSTTLTCDVPKLNLRDDSAIEFYDCWRLAELLNDVLQNMDRLIVLPTGCGEHSLANCAPGVTVYAYLREYGQHTPTTLGFVPPPVRSLSSQALKEARNGVHGETFQKGSRNHSHR